MRGGMRPALLAAFLLGACKAPAKAPVRVAAASDLTAAFEAMRAPFEQDSGEQLELIFGSSGQLSKQLVEGAPFDLFASANTAFTEAPAAAGACDAATRATYAEGYLVVFAPSQKLTALADLAEPRFVKIAIANPEHAPYGQLAKDALVKAGLWSAVEPKLVYGQNIQHVLQLAKSGNAEAALVARSLAKDGFSVDAPALKQALVVCGRGKNADGAKKFRAFVLGPHGRKVLGEAGFGLP